MFAVMSDYVELCNIETPSVSRSTDMCTMICHAIPQNSIALDELSFCRACHTIGREREGNVLFPAVSSPF